MGPRPPVLFGRICDGRAARISLENLIGYCWTGPYFEAFIKQIRVGRRVRWQWALFLGEMRVPISCTAFLDSFEDARKDLTQNARKIRRGIDALTARRGSR